MRMRRRVQTFDRYSESVIDFVFFTKKAYHVITDILTYIRTRTGV